MDKKIEVKEHTSVKGKSKKGLKLFLAIASSLAVAGIGVTAGYFLKPTYNVDGIADDVFVDPSVKQAVKVSNIKINSVTGNKEMDVCSNSDDLEISNITVSKGTTVLTVNIDYVIEEKSTSNDNKKTYKIIILKRVLDENPGTIIVNATTESISFEVQFKTNGGSEVKPQKVYKNKCALSPSSSKKDCILEGWYENSSLSGNPFNFKTPITQNITLYAKWKDASEEIESLKKQLNEAIKKQDELKEELKQAEKDKEAAIQAKNEAIAAKDEALAAKAKAEQDKAKAEQNLAIAVKAKEDAEKKEAEAIKAKEEAEKKEAEAIAAKDQALADKAKAESERDAAVSAKEAAEAEVEKLKKDKDASEEAKKEALAKLEKAEKDLADAKQALTEAIAAKDQAILEKNNAIADKNEAIAAKNAAIAAKEEAEDERDAAIAAKEEAEDARDAALDAANKAKAAQEKAESDLQTANAKISTLEQENTGLKAQIVTLNNELAAYKNRLVANFDTDHGSAIIFQYVEKGGKVTKPTDPTREGYKFQYWYDVEDTEKKSFDFEKTTLSKSIILKAAWTINSYTITWNNYKGEKIKTTTVNHGVTPVFDGDTPTKTLDGHNCIFTGWKDSDGKPIATATKDATYIAQFNDVKLSYSVNFVIPGEETIYDTSIVNYQEKIVKPTDPIRPGKTFAGWYKESTCVNKWDFDKDVVSNNMTLYASFSLKEIPSGILTYTPVAGNITVSSVDYEAISKDLTKLVDTCYFSIPSQVDGKNVTAIGDSAFLMVSTYEQYDCIHEIHLPDSIKTIGANAFYDRSKLRKINLDSITSIGEYAFAYCEKLSSITFNDSLTTIPSYCFYECSNLKSITLPSNLKSISANAFSYCGELNKVHIPASVETIADGAFGACNNIIEVTFDGSVINKMSSTSGLFPMLLKWYGSVKVKKDVTIETSSTFYNSFEKRGESGDYDIYKIKGAPAL